MGAAGRQEACCQIYPRRTFGNCQEGGQDAQEAAGYGAAMNSWLALILPPVWQNCGHPKIPENTIPTPIPWGRCRICHEAGKSSSKAKHGSSPKPLKSSKPAAKSRGKMRSYAIEQDASGVSNPLNHRAIQDILRRTNPRIVRGACNEPLPNGGGHGMAHRGLGPEMKKPWTGKGWK